MNTEWSEEFDEWDKKKAAFEATEKLRIYEEVERNVHRLTVWNLKRMQLSSNSALYLES